MRGTGLGMALGAFLASGCRNPSSGDTLETTASPQAAAEPAPLATLPAAPVNGAPITGEEIEGSPPKVSLRGDRPVEADPPSRESVVYTLLAVLRPSDLSALPKGAEYSQAGLESARKKTDALLSIDFTPTRARIVFATAGFALPAGTELRARSDRYGHVVLDPDGSIYRVAAPGVLRALLGERRLDVAPLSGASVEDVGDGPKRVGRPTRNLRVTTRAASGQFEITHVPDAGDGGSLVCRALLDLINAPPQTQLCGDGDVPLHVELRWTPPGTPAGAPPQRASRTGMITFDAYALARRNDVSPSAFAAPPATARYEESLPEVRSEVLLTTAELGALRAGGAGDSQADLTLANSTDELRFLWLDGVPVAWLAPGAREALHGLPRGRYAIQWRTFLADAIDPVQSVTLPASSDVGGFEAGAL